MGTSLGDKVVIVIALLLLAVVAVVSAELSWDYPRCAICRGPVEFAVSHRLTIRHCLAEKRERAEG